jgi:cobalt-zinc-cadmium efflux system outer membrane protein
VCTVFLIGPVGQAAAEVLTLASAIELTLARNPELRVYAPRRLAASEHAAIATLRPPLVLEAETQDVLGTGRASGFDSAETTFALSQVIELGDKRELRTNAANTCLARLANRNWLAL